MLLLCRIFVCYLISQFFFFFMFSIIISSVLHKFMLFFSFPSCLQFFLLLHNFLCFVTVISSPVYTPSLTHFFFLSLPLSFLLGCIFSLPVLYVLLFLQIVFKFVSNKNSSNIQISKGRVLSLLFYLFIIFIDD